MFAAAKHTALAAVSGVLLIAVCIAVPAGAHRDRGGDRSDPSAPTNLRVVAATMSEVSVVWDRAQDDVGVVGYSVREGDGAGRHGGKDKRGKERGDRSTSVPDPAYTVDDLDCGTSVSISVAAFDAAENLSKWVSTTASTAACVDTEPPSAPSHFVQAATTKDAVVLTWDRSTDNFSVVGYGVYTNMERRASTTDPVVTFSRLVCGSTRRYLIDAFDAAGNRSSLGTAYVQTAPCSSSPPSPADRSAPSTPTGLADSNVTQTGLTLTWNASSDNVGVSDYDVYRNGTKVASPSSASASQTGLSCGTSYAFAVAARDAAGNVSRQATLTVATAPCQPSSLPAPSPPSSDATPPSQPTSLAVSDISQSSLTLTWNASSDNVGVSDYDVYRNGTKVASPSSTSASQTGLSCGTSYAFAVAARDAAGNVSRQATLTVATAPCQPSSLPAPSPPSSDTTPPSQPTSLAVSDISQSSLTLTWNASSDNVGVSDYDVYRNGTKVASPRSTSASQTGLSCGTSYAFEVAARDAAGNVSRQATLTVATAPCQPSSLPAPSPPSSDTTPPSQPMTDTQAPTAPANVVASSRTATSIALTWSPSTDNVGVVGYGLYRVGSPAGTTSSTTGIFAGLSCNTNYTLAVDVVDAAGNRSAKTIVMVATTACPDTTAPSTPTGLAAKNVAQTSLELSWNASTDNVGVTGYDVFRNAQKVATVSGASSTQTVLACGTSYTFSVAARDAAGNTSAQTQASASTAACSTVVPAAAPAYTADFETADFSQVLNLQQITSGRITLTTTNPLEGTYSALVRNGPGDYPVAGGQRTEITVGVPSDELFGGASLQGKESWVAWDEKLDSNFEVAGWAILTQFHGGSGSPVFAIQANGASPAGLVAIVRGGPVNGNFRAHVLAGTVPLGTRLQFKVYHRWSTGSDGRVQVWLNGELKATIDGPNLYTGYERDTYQKAGIYRGGGNPTRESLAWVDNIRWWRSDPGNTTAPSTPTATTAPSTPTDTTAPSTPTGLAAKNVAQTSLELSWNASTDNVGVTGYDVFRNAQKVATVSGASSTQTVLACGTSYTFSVAARDAAGNTSAQTQASASTAACSTVVPAAAPAYTADFEGGTMDGISTGGQVVGSGRVTVETSGALSGTRSVLVRNGPNDTPAAGGYRTEMNVGTISSRLFGGASLQGRQTWITYELRMDSNFEVGPSWKIISQLHGGSGSPVFALILQGSTLSAIVRGGAVNGNVQTHALVTPIPFGSRLYFKVHHRWSTASDGLVEVWWGTSPSALTGTPDTTFNGPNVYSAYSSEPYQKAGVYTYAQPTRESTIMFDNFRWYTRDPD